jgi:hypothetical protein
MQINLAFSPACRTNCARRYRPAFMLLIWIKSQSACGQAELSSRKTSATEI